MTTTMTSMNRQRTASAAHSLVWWVARTNVAALFDLSNYNITSWMTDYLSETQGNYYTQRWYIARRDQGSVSLCDYYPPTDDNSILNGDHWYRINTSDPNFYPNSTQREQILANSENHAGWSRSRVQQLTPRATASPIR